MLSKLNPLNIVKSTFGVLRNHKWKSALLIGTGVFGYSLYRKFKSGYGELQKIMDQLEKMKKDLPEGQNVEDGTEEEFDFFKDMMK